MAHVQAVLHTCLMVLQLYRPLEQIAPPPPPPPPHESMHSPFPTSCMDACIFPSCILSMVHLLVQPCAELVLQLTRTLISKLQQLR